MTQTQIAVTIIGGIFTLGVALVTGILARRASPYSALADRVVRLEERTDKLEAENEALDRQIRRERRENRGYIRQLLAALREHAPGVPIPDPPPWYAD